MSAVEWTDALVAELRRLVRQGLKRSAIADAMRLDPQCISDKLNDLGLTTQSMTTTWPGRNDPGLGPDHQDRRAAADAQIGSAMLLERLQAFHPVPPR